MNYEQKYLESNKNIIREKIFTDNEEREKEKKIEEEKLPKNFAFNLEYQKILNPNNGQSKITSELNKLIKFIRERYYYRDINGNRIKPKGELLPTPFQKMEKLNEDIKSYYANKINRKNSPFILKNHRNKQIFLKNNYNIYKSLSVERKRTNKNYFSSKKLTKAFEEINLNNNLNNNRALENRGLQKNITLLINNNMNKQNNKKNNTENKDIKVCLSETYNKRRKKFFSDLQFNQINFWKTNMLYPLSLNSNHKIDNIFGKTTKYKNFISEYKKRNNDILSDKIPKINKNEKNKTFNNTKSFKESNFYKQKTKDISKGLNKYNLIQFNMNQLIKQDKEHQDKIVLNMRRTYNKFNNINMMENKTINVNIDNTKNI